MLKHVSLLAMVTATLFPTEAQAKEPPEPLPAWAKKSGSTLTISGTIPATELDCTAWGAKKLRLVGPVRIQAEGSVDQATISCPSIEFREGSQLLSNLRLGINASKRLSGTVHVTTAAGAGSDALPTPELWEVREGRSGGAGANGGRGGDAHTRVEWKKIRIGPFKTKAYPKYINESASGGGNGAVGGGGETGRAGQKGGPGSAGRSAGGITLHAASLDSGSHVLLEATGGAGGAGGKGGRGWNGGDGGPGGAGGNGGDGNLVHPGKSGGHGGPGGAGGAGGKGGEGGDGGSGGSGGSIILAILNGKYKPDQITIRNGGGAGGTSGAGGDGGSGGRGGAGGLPGCGGRGGSFAGVRTNKPGDCGTNGRAGTAGPAGEAGAAGSPGKRGEDGPGGTFRLETVKPRDHVVDATPF